MNEARTESTPGAGVAPTASAATRTTLFVAAFGFWLLLAWPVSPADGGILWVDVGFGAIAAAFVSFVMREWVTRDFGRLLQPARYFWLVAYLVVLGWYVTRANLDVAYRVLHPGLPINPGIVAVRTGLRTLSARTALAISITLTPGTLALDITDDGVLYVHWIDVTTTDEAETTLRIIGRLEWFLSRIFE